MRMLLVAGILMTVGLSYAQNGYFYDLGNSVGYIKDSKGNKYLVIEDNSGAKLIKVKDDPEKLMKDKFGGISKEDLKMNGDEQWEK